MTIEIRAIEPDEIDAMLVADQRGFGQQPHPPEFNRSWAEGELDRTRVAFDGGEIIGISRAYSFEMVMPGGATVPAAAVSWVSVLPTHRRQGVLTRMINALHDDARERGEPAAILTASESLIYGRFGYGIATWRVGLSAQRSQITFLDSAPPAGDVRLVGIDEGKTLLPEIYSRIGRERAGMVTRTDFWWPSVFWDYMFGNGKKAEFIAIHRNEQGIDDGWVAYESQGKWTDGLPHGTLQAWDLLGADATVRAALERYCFEVDLLDRVEFVHAPVDDPLRHMVTDPRRVRVDYVNDGLWIAPLDPQVLLASRTYATPGRVVLDIEGTAYAIEATDDKVSVEVSADPPDLACNTAVLGMTILGGNRWDELASAGRVAVHNANALALADQMFATSPAPALFTGF